MQPQDKRKQWLSAFPEQTLVQALGKIVSTKSTFPVKLILKSKEIESKQNNSSIVY